MASQQWNAYWQQDDEAELSWWKRPAPEVLEWLAELSSQHSLRALDLGCGLGRHAVALAQAGFQVTATDLSDSAVEHARQWAEQLGLNIETQVCAAQDHIAPDASFDLILSYNVIYHGSREQFAQAINNVWRLLKPGGQFFFTCPSRRDGKYGFGREVAPHTFECEKSVTPGDIHYFADEQDLDNLLRNFQLIRRIVDEGWWENQGQPQFFSNWQIWVKKPGGQ